ncbi:MAG: hypothetical protein Q9163_000752 [Psora crenata]
MAEAAGPDKTRSHTYPKPIEGPKSPYIPRPATNPVLRGTSLVIAGWAAAYISPLSRYLWANAGLGDLRDVRELNDYEPRYDPTVIPRDSEEAVGLVKKAEVSGQDVQGSRCPNTSISTYHAAYKAGDVTPTDVVEALLDFLDKDAGHKVDFLSIIREKVLAAAESSTRRYKEGSAKSVLDGVPVAVKDEVDLEGHSKTLGSAKELAGPAYTTSWCVRKWEDAGAIVLGKLNMHELGFGTTGNNPIAGTPINPHNSKYYPGGSSSASATTVASNLLPLTIGRDGGGSIRIPSADCGVYGLKPTHGRVSCPSTTSFAFSTSVTGPMAGNMADLEIGYNTMAIPNPGDKVSAIFTAPGARSTRRGRKIIGVCKQWFDRADTSVQTLCHDALTYYASSGYEMVDVDLPYLREGQLAHALTILTEVGAAFTNSRGFIPANRLQLAIAAQTPARDFLLAQNMRSLLMSHLSHLFQRYPGLLIVTPTTPDAGQHINSPAELTHGVSDTDMTLRTMTYTWLANFTGCPAISIPIGKVEGQGGEGRVPVGLMALGEWGDEEGLLEWGKVGEDGSWGRSMIEGNWMARPERWVDVLGMAKGRRDGLRR